MAITSGNWSSATDPFILATDVTYTGTLGELTYNRILLYNTTGLLNGVIDKDRQDLFWQNDADPDLTFPASALQTFGTGPAASLYEFGSIQKDAGGGTWESFVSNDLVEADTKDARVYLAGRGAGAVLYSLFAYVALAWTERDPAQILFSWIAHYLDDSVFTPKDYLDQASFQAASDYYDLNPCGLTVIRESGKSIADQAKAVVDHTADFVGIVPNVATGAVTMRFFVRGALDDRTTPIDLESKSVKSYTVRPTDRYTLDRIDAVFGSLVMITGSLSASDGSDYDFGFPIDFPHVSRNHAVQKVGGAAANNSIDLDLPYHRTRDRLANHVDIRYWKDRQDEAEIEFSDWSHLNFEAGDVVHLVGQSYTGDEDFLVVEKTMDLDALTASVRCVQIRGHAGKSPRYADNANMICHLRPNELGYFVEGSAAFPKQVAKIADPRNLDRWFEASARYTHAQQINRGTGGPAGANPSPPQMALDQVARWPVLEFDGLSGMMQKSDTGRKTVAPNSITTAVDLTFYAVIRVDDTAAALDMIWHHVYGGVTIGFGILSGVPKYYAGSYIGSGSALAGWQIVVWTLKDPASSTIRRNGVQLHSGGAYTKVVFSSLAEVAIGCNYAGNTYQFDGAIAELAIFKTAHSLATTQAIESHLAQKYGITI